MKRTDLEKLNGLKIRSRMKGASTPPRFGAASSGASQDKAVNSLVEKLLGKVGGKPKEG